MKNKIIEFVKCKEFLAPFLSGIAVLMVWAIIQVLISGIRGMNFSSAINSIVEVANMRVSLLWVIVISFFFSLFNSIAIYGNRKKNDELFVKKDYLTERLKGKLDTSTFESFEDSYDIRRLESHPWHNQYIGTSANIGTYCSMLWDGIHKKDSYKVDNAMQGLVIEIKKQGCLHKDNKSRIINLLSEYKEERYNEYKEELIKLLDNIRLV